MRNPIARVGKSDPNSRSKVPLDHFSATVEVCTALRSRNKPWPARGGCHERSSQRSTTVLLLNRVGYRDCDRGRDTDHLTVEPRLSAVGPSLAASLQAEHVSCLSSSNELPGICYFSSVVALGKGQEKQELLRLIGTLGRKFPRSGDVASF
jgi:hypothetical protein